MPFVNRKSGASLMGRPVMAMMQLSTCPNSKADFILYESMEGHGFFLREVKEFIGKFNCISESADLLYWTHKEKGGKYRAHEGRYHFDGTDIDWDLSVHDGSPVHAYVDGQGYYKFVNGFASKFVFAADTIVHITVKKGDRVTYTMKDGSAASINIPCDGTYCVYNKDLQVNGSRVIRVNDDGSYVMQPTIDGVPVEDGDNVLLKGDGIYTVKSGEWDDGLRQFQKMRHALNYSGGYPRQWEYIVRREKYGDTAWVNLPNRYSELDNTVNQAVNGKNELLASLPFIEQKNAEHAQNFIRVYKDSGVHVAVVKRTGHKALAIRGDDLDYVLKAAEAVLRNQN